MNQFDDATILKELHAIDEDETVEVQQWEADFIESIFNWKGTLTARQAQTALDIIERYER